MAKSGIFDFDNYELVRRGVESLETMKASAEEDSGNVFGLKTMFQQELHNHISLISHWYGIFVQSDDEVIPTLKMLLKQYEAENSIDAQRAEKEAKQERKKAEQERTWKAEGRCLHCGGKIGLFGKCKSCGRKS